MGEGADMARDQEEMFGFFDIEVRPRRRGRVDVRDSVDLTTTWVTADKRVVKIVEMTDSHLVNTVHWMLRKVGAFGEKVSFINRQLAGLSPDDDVAERLDFSERFNADVEYNSSARFAAAAKNWPSFIPMVNEGIRRGIFNNFARG